MTHICVSNLIIIGSDNGLSPGRRQAIIWTNAGILFIGSLGTNFSEILIAILTSSFKKMHLRVSSGKWRPFCLRLNVLRDAYMPGACRFCLQAHKSGRLRAWLGKLFQAGHMIFLPTVYISFTWFIQILAGHVNFFSEHEFSETGAWCPCEPNA